MKTLILSGSPHKNGDSAALLSELCANLSGKIDVFSAYYDNISPCFDCRHCWTYDNCSVEDDMQKIYKNLDEYDNVVFVSPLYFAELSGPLLGLTSRFQLLFASNRFRNTDMITKRKRGGLIITGGGGSGGIEHAEKTALRLLHLLKADCVEKVYSLNTDDLPAKDDQTALEAARRLAVALSAPTE